MHIFLQFLFAALLAVAGFLFARNIGRIRRNIFLGHKVGPLSETKHRWANVLLIAIGQRKMVRRWVPGLLHVMIYVGFLVVNVEVLEIVVDGLAGTHRFFGHFGGVVYDAVIFMAEVFMGLVFVACVGFLFRRDVAHLKRFEAREMRGWNHLDARIILWTEIVLVSALLIMNATDQVLQSREALSMGAFPISHWLVPLFTGLSTSALQGIEQTAWWLHIVGILAFLNYIPFSKHFHIFTAFPQVYYSDTNVLPKGEFPNDPNVQKEVELMLHGDPYAAPAETTEAPKKFGAKDIFDLKWTDLLAAYTCTECGRCTSECPANITGKLLSPRKIMMDTRDRIEHVGRVINEKGKWEDDGKSLLGDYILPEEIWACTTCNACVEACPVNIRPLSIIHELRQYQVMEESAGPAQLNAMFNNMTNTGSPWTFAAADRFNWANNLTATLPATNGHAPTPEIAPTA